MDRGALDLHMRSNLIATSVKVTKIKPMLFTARDGTMTWMCNGRLHREDGPAVIHANGEKQWWLDGCLHREDGPAVDSHTMQSWYIKHKLHRIDGPALIRHGLYNDWWVHGRQLTEEEFYLYVDTLSGEVLIPPGKKLKYEGFNR